MAHVLASRRAFYPIDYRLGVGDVCLSGLCQCAGPECKNTAALTCKLIFLFQKKKLSRNAQDIRIEQLRT
jgi:hypothetical protein